MDIKQIEVGETYFVRGHCKWNLKYCVTANDGEIVNGYHPIELDDNGRRKEHDMPMFYWYTAEECYLYFESEVK